MPKSRLPEASIAEYETLLVDVSRLLEQARQSAGRAVNAVMTTTYWQLGRRIVEQEQQGLDRASYGEELRLFFLAYREKIQTVSGLLANQGFPLFMVALRSPADRARGASSELLRKRVAAGGGSVRQLDRQIASRAYNRLRPRRKSSVSTAEFVARQRRLRVGTEWYRVDLLFFHRRLRCLVVIDLKIGKFAHADAGQMNL